MTRPTVNWPGAAPLLCVLLAATLSSGLDHDVDCGVRELALEFSQDILDRQELRVFEGLELGSRCGATPPADDPPLKPPPLEVGHSREEASFASDGHGSDSDSDVSPALAAQYLKIFVSAGLGNDNNSGKSRAFPVQTLERAIELSRATDRKQSSPVIVVMEGVYYLSETIQLNAIDSGLTIAGDPLAETRPVVSAGKVLKLDWEEYDENIVVADNPHGAFDALFVDGQRMIRARYPNANPETTGLYTTPNGYTLADDWLPPKPTAEPYEIHISEPSRSKTLFPTFQVGMDGPVSQFDPPVSYWGTKHPVGGGGSTYTITSGLNYKDGQFDGRVWKNPETAIVHAFHSGYWGNWMFEVDEYDPANRTIGWSKGGFQEARGRPDGAEWYVENVFEELDYPGEWFLDEKENKVYLFLNGTRPESVVVSNLKSVLRIEGSQRSPVRDIHVQGLEFAHTLLTFMDSYEVPSGGDWSIHRGGAVFVEGAENIHVHSCTFQSLGGNALFLSNYLRDVFVVDNDFAWLGDSAIGIVGSAQLMDGTDGNHPERVHVERNLVREVGIFGKQTAPVFMALTARVSIEDNVFFNGPRAGVNINDGFGGGHLIRRNLMFNLVRETSDHGPINTWDRQTYVTRKNGDGEPSTDTATTQITRNFLIANYHSVWPIDHDDGSCEYLDTYNFMTYGGFKNYLGHSKVATNNVYIYPDQKPDQGPPHNDFFTKPFCANSDGQTLGTSGWGDVWANNKCIMGNPVVYEYGSCEPGENMTQLIPFSALNQFYIPGGKIDVKCGSASWDLEGFQQQGFDIGSTVQEPVGIKDIMEWGREVLELPTEEPIDNAILRGK